MYCEEKSAYRHHEIALVEMAEASSLRYAQQIQPRCGRYDAYPDQRTGFSFQEKAVYRNDNYIKRCYETCLAGSCVQKPDLLQISCGHQCGPAAYPADEQGAFFLFLLLRSLLLSVRHLSVFIIVCF